MYISLYLQMQVGAHRSAARKPRQQSRYRSNCIYISQGKLLQWEDVPMFAYKQPDSHAQPVMLTRVKRVMVINLTSKSLKYSCDVSV